MFGKRLTELAPIKEALAPYMMRASEKLRAQNSLLSPETAESSSRRN